MSLGSVWEEGERAKNGSRRLVHEMKLGFRLRSGRASDRSLMMSVSNILHRCSKVGRSKNPKIYILKETVCLNGTRVVSK